MARSNVIKKPVFFTVGIIFFIIIWQVFAILVNSEIIIPAPLIVIRKFFILVTSPVFLKSLFFTFLRLLTAFFISAVFGLLLGIICALNASVMAFFQPFFTFISSTPVMALILIAYLIFGSDVTPIFIGILLIFPLLVSNIIEGFKALDNKRIELFTVYKMTKTELVRYLILPALKPFIWGGLRAGLSLGWKVIIAAEVLVQPYNALGAGMQNAKAHLETAELFAWTLATIIASVITNTLFSVFSQRSGFKV